MVSNFINFSWATGYIALVQANQSYEFYKQIMTPFVEVRPAFFFSFSLLSCTIHNISSASHSVFFITFFSSFINPYRTTGRHHASIRGRFYGL